MYYYAFTLDKVQLPSLPHYYLNWLTTLKGSPGATVAYNFEEGKQGRLHIHGMVESPRRLYVKRLHPGEGYSFHFEPVKSQIAWQCYIKKDKHKEHELLERWNKEEREFYKNPDPDEIDIPQYPQFDIRNLKS